MRLTLYANKLTVLILSIFSCFVDTGSQSSKIAMLTWKDKVKKLKQHLERLSYGKTVSYLTSER